MGNVVFASKEIKTARKLKQLEAYCVIYDQLMC